MSNSIAQIAKKLTTVYELNPLMAKILEGASEYSIYIKNPGESISSSEENCFGITLNNKSIYLVSNAEILAGEDDAITQFVALLTHELVHAACNYFFCNDCLPYPVADLNEDQCTFVSSLNALIPFCDDDKELYTKEGIAYFIGHYVEICLSSDIGPCDFLNFMHIFYDQMLEQKQGLARIINYLDNSNGFIADLDENGLIGEV